MTDVVLNGERRVDRRHEVSLELRLAYTAAGQRQTTSGVTFELSRDVLRFLAQDPLPEGAEAEVHIAWPFRLQNVCPLELVLEGAIVGTTSRGTVLRVRRHEFRTCGERSFAEAGGESGLSMIA